MDFGLLPPEINSGRMYAGPGAGPLLAAVAAWGALAEQMHSAAAAYESVIAELTGQWQGPSAARMLAALEPYRIWMAATAGQAETTAMQAMTAVSAYEDAFCATVPPPVIAANRTQLATLVATNFFGQNAPAIMATEVHYAEMWAQDAAAMYGYAGRAASTLPQRPFDPPPGGAHPASAPPPADPSSPLSAVDAFLTGPFSPLELYKLPAVAQLLAGQCYLLPRAMGNLLGALGKTALPAAGGELLTRGLLPPFAGPLPAGAMSASVGRAELIGALSVPKTWASPAPAIGAAAGALPRGVPTTLTAVVAADGQQSLLANLAASSMAGQTPSRARGGIPAAGLGSLAGGSDTEPDVPAVSNIFIIPEDESPDCAAEAMR